MRLLQPLPWVFAVLQYLRNILHLIDSLSFDLQAEVNIIIIVMVLLGSVTSSKMAAKMAAILDFTKIQIYRENSKIANIFC